MINKIIIMKFIYIIFAYSSLEVINHLESAIKDVKIDTSTLSPIIIQCETCGVSKTIKLISRKTDNKEIIRELGII